MIRAITFEAHDNLIHYEWFPRAAGFAERCRAAGIELSPAAALAAARACRRYEEEHHLRGARVTAEWFRARDAAGLRAAGIVEDVEHSVALVRQAAKSMPARFPATQGYTLDPDVPGVLEALRARGVALAVVSNMPRGLKGILATLGIAPHFATVITCGDRDGRDEGVAADALKPDPRLYALACQRLGVSPADCLHVGDSPYDDGGFAACGVRVVIYDPLECLTVAMERITRLRDLARIVDQAAPA